jgi:hypothetical protein
VTIVEQLPTLTPELTVDPTAAAAFDTYRDIHKGIRAELFAVTLTAGNVDPSDKAGRSAVAAHVNDVVEVLVEHAGHEDAHVGPALEAAAPALVERIEVDHAALDARIERVAQRAMEAIDSPAEEQRNRMHNLYLDLASFTSAYLAHQELEERVVLPTLLDTIGIEATVAIHQAIVGSIAPQRMAQTLAFMLPAMNNDDRTELLGGVRQSAPPEAFAANWSLVKSVLEPTDVRVLATRLGLS